MKVTYLDHAATSPLLPEVKQAMIEAMDAGYGNASALHTPGHAAANAIEQARKEVAKLINADPNEIIFTSGGSEANNMVMHTFAGQPISVSAIEHPSVLESAKIWSSELRVSNLLEHRFEPSVIFTNAHGKNSVGSPACQVRSEFFPPERCQNDHGAKNGSNKLLTSALFSIMLANNELGTIFPIRDLAATAHTHDAKFHTDATQALGKIPIDVRQLDVDYLTISAHKIGGPTGIGALYVKHGVPIKPLILGGHQEHKLRAGTYNTLGIIGFGAAAQYALDHNTPHIYETKIRPLRDQLAERILNNVEESRVNAAKGKLLERRFEPSVISTNTHGKNSVGSPACQVRSEFLSTECCENDHGAKNGSNNLSFAATLPNILNVSFHAAEGESIQLYLDAEGIIVSTGSACAAGDIKPSHVLMALTHDAEIAHSSIRFSLGLTTTQSDIDHTMSVLPGIIKRLQEISTI